MQHVRLMMSKVFKVSPTILVDNATMKDVPGWDSLNHIDLIISLEKEFNIQLSGDEIAEMVTVKAIEDILKKHGVK